MEKPIDKFQCEKQIKNYSCIEEDKECKTIEGISPKNYIIFEGKEICVVRKKETYYDSIRAGKIIAKNKNCPENKKLCGIVDTLERKLCINKEEDCPINKASINKFYEETTLNNFISKINFDKDNIMNFLDEENDENKIISIIKLSDGLPCLNISQKNWISYHPDERYKIQNCIQ